MLHNVSTTNRKSSLKQIHNKFYTISLPEIEVAIMERIDRLCSTQWHGVHTLYK